MAKCDLDFDFDRPNRNYRSGETVHGRLKLQADSAINSQKVTLIAGWKTHGKGNTSTGDYASLELHQGELQSGRIYEFPFEFVIPGSPWTYRGTLINVVHVVKARVHVAWAFDPQSETEFEVQPSPVTQPINSPPPLAAESPAGVILGTTISLALILGGIPFLFMYGCGLIPMGIGGFLLFMTYRNRLAERKLGKVDLQLAPQSQTPGEEIVFSLAFTPRSRVNIDRILITLEGQEQAVSGSGTNKTTHRHKLFEQQVTVAEAIELAAGSPYRAEQRLRVPEHQAYTVDLGDNKIGWAAKVRLDIPKWPDWERVVPLHVIPKTNSPQAIASPPREMISEVAGTKENGDPWAGELATPETSPYHDLPQYSSMTPSSSTVAPLSNSPSPALPSPPAIELLSLISSIAAAPRFGDQRSQLVERSKDLAIPVAIEVERSSYNYGIYDDESFRNGRTLIGTLLGTETKVAIQLPESQNESASSLSSGALWTGLARPARWDDLYDRLELRSVR